jgi:deazaflavin-dependent oxidoreductase (nitroreductase family)
VFFFRLLMPLAAGEVSRYRKNATAEPRTFRGFPTVLVTTVGAKTGVERTHVLGGFKDKDDSWLIIASNGGAAAHPQWFINLAKNPDKVWLEVGNTKFHVRPVELKGAEYEDAYARIAAAAPGYGKYRKVTDREIPVIRLSPIS